MADAALRDLERKLSMDPGDLALQWRVIAARRRSGVPLHPRWVPAERSSRCRINVFSWAEAQDLFARFWTHVTTGSGQLLDIGFRHADRCGQCNQALTVAESIDTGFGPDCASALQIPWRRLGEGDQVGQAYAFALAGRATFTLTPGPDHHRTYKVSRESTMAGVSWSRVLDSYYCATGEERVTLTCSHGPCVLHKAREVHTADRRGALSATTKAWRKAHEHPDRPWTVKVLTGPDNSLDTNYLPIGSLVAPAGFIPLAAEAPASLQQTLFGD